MSWQDNVAALAQAVLKAVGGNVAAPPAAPAPLPPVPTATRAAALTPAHFSALASLFNLLPIDDIVALINGAATVDNVLDLAQRAAEIVKVAFPPAAMTAGEVSLALEALKFILDASGVGPDPFVVTGGLPPSVNPGLAPHVWGQP